MKNETIKVTPMQLACALVLEAQAAQLQIGANQLGSYLKQVREADILIQAQQLIQRELVKLQQEWAGALVVAQPGDLKALERATP